ncbi:MAG: glutaredoxin domain-containing protein [Dehalococcoidia bacterium]|nr:glutaredoxin domain-containing protein [Chloroflexota bacterium]MCZ6867016.1 glutaredoxin domain-containing protein [Chloroflexota bacterium]
MAVPVVYTILHCPACEKLREVWGDRGVEYEEKRVDESQDALDEALEYGSIVPIIVYPDGRVEEGQFEGVSG